jgi:hypothetical protein
LRKQRGKHRDSLSDLLDHLRVAIDDDGSMHAPHPLRHRGVDIHVTMRSSIGTATRRDVESLQKTMVMAMLSIVRGPLSVATIEAAKTNHSRAHATNAPDPYLYHSPPR